MVSTDPVDFLARFWTRLPGSYNFQRHSLHTYIIEGKSYWNKDILSPSAGQAVFWKRRPTSPMYDREMVEVSVISIRTVDGKQETFGTSRVYRISKNGSLSIWSIFPGSCAAGAKTFDMAFQIDTKNLAGYRFYPSPVVNEGVVQLGKS